MRRYEEELDDLERELKDYFGYLYIKSTGTMFQVKVENPGKPEILNYVEQMRAFNMQAFPGALVDQPYYFMRELQIAQEQTDIYIEQMRQYYIEQQKSAAGQSAPQF